MSKDIVVKKAKKGGPKKVGRPSKYTKALRDKICAELAIGRSVKWICEQEWGPGIDTFYRWLNGNVEFRESYTRAKEDGAEAVFNEIREIAEDDSGDLLKIKDDEGNVIDVKSNHAAVQRSKLKVDTYKWMLAKIMPKKYSDRLAIDGQTEHTGRVDVSLKNKSDEELVKLAAEFAGASKAGLPRRTSSPRNDKGSK
jgi:hypothetical protein